MKDKKMEQWVRERIKLGYPINMSSIDRKKISIYCNIYLFLFYKKLFFWEMCRDGITEFFVKVFKTKHSD